MTEKEAQGCLPGALPDDLLARLAEEMAEHGIAPAWEGRTLRAELPEGRAVIALGSRGLTARVTARDALHLHQIREGMAHLVEHVLPGSAAALAWTGDLDPAGSMPPNLQLAGIVSVDRFGSSFLRVELSCPGAAAFARGGMHFSLLLPPRGRAPVWPRIDARGRTIWAEGAEALHRAAFTFVEVDPGRGRIVFDVFDHAGGPAADWIRHARKGETVALMGPGGGEAPPGDVVLLAGDETALPAIRHILERSDAGRRGHVILEIGRPEDRTALTAPPGITVDWVLRDRPGAFWQRLLDAPLPPVGENRFVWIAAEQALVRRAKRHFRALGIAREESCFAAYWAA
ncbi:siderophore-interacting protein [Cereibacter sphaeroides]|uniref:siderophore-interacting protein n=1 Tax=Cereibacter sphaeroides TaxID=1063 RepID=UPI001F459C1C|nr:siderophore-interacting protein [Cereibacter sphaeroides]MCE6951500.1 siderophore-interacting protein [Cereibacter sphaeroides]